MNIKEIREMINLMNENGLMELEVEKEGMRIRLKKTGAGVYAEPMMIERQPMAVEANKPAQDGPGPEKPQTKTIEIKAPMVGTFYRAASPESPPFVEVGQTIEPGQVICIVEAMKLMNEIKSEMKGRISEIIVENAEPVEFGQPMFIVEPL